MNNTNYFKAKIDNLQSSRAEDVKEKSRKEVLEMEAKLHKLETELETREGVMVLLLSVFLYFFHPVYMYLYVVFLSIYLSIYMYIFLLLIINLAVCLSVLSV